MITIDNTNMLVIIGCGYYDGVYELVCMSQDDRPKIDLAIFPVCLADSLKFRMVLSRDTRQMLHAYIHLEF